MDKIDKENIIKSFDEYLKENNFKITNNWKNNQNLIDMYIMSIYYDIFDNIDDSEEIDRIEYYIDDLLNDYCDTNAIPLF